MHNAAILGRPLTASEISVLEEALRLYSGTAPQETSGTAKRLWVAAETARWFAEGEEEFSAKIKAV